MTISGFIRIGEEDGTARLVGSFYRLLGSASDTAGIVMGIPVWVQIGGVVVGVAGLGALAWLRRNRGGGSGRARPEPSPIRVGFLALLLAAAVVGLVRGPSHFRLDLLGVEATPRGVAETLGVSAEPAESPGLARYAAALSALPNGHAPVTTGGSVVTQPRPFRHSQHEVVTCSQCHGTGEEHRTTVVQTPRDCAACHHDPGLTRYTCTDCHGPRDLPAPGPVPATLTLTVWDEPHVRELPFDHVTHAERQCQDCHTGPVLLAVETECASCHQEHHSPEAECTSCHLPTEPEAHDVEVHLTCSGSGCHSGDRGERPPLSRTLCLACHDDQRDHEPGGDCATCHMIPAEPVEPAGFRSWLSQRRGGGS